MDKVTFISTGTTALDHALGGGLPIPSRIAITGGYGVGKTRLLEQFGRRLLPYFGNKVWFGMDSPSADYQAVLLDGDPLLKDELLIKRRLLIVVLQASKPYAMEPFDVVLHISTEGSTTRYTVLQVVKNKFGEAGGRFAI